MSAASIDMWDVDIIISTYNRGDSIDQTIASIRASGHRRFTLWVLDQSDDARTERCVARHAEADPRVRYVRAPLRGLCATRNAGSRLGSAPYILFTNDDVRVDAGWVGALVRDMAQNRAWCAFGRVLPGGVAPELVHSTTVLGLKTSLRHETYGPGSMNLGFGHGHNMAVARQRFEQLGGFDELLGAGSPLGAWDERDFGYRVLLHGGTITYTPEALAFHHHAQDSRGVWQSFRNYGAGTGAAVGKYLRCGKFAALYLLFEWMFSQGVRQIVSGVVRRQGLGKVRAGFEQLYFPIVGLIRSLRYAVDRETLMYRPPQLVADAQPVQLGGS